MQKLKNIFQFFNKFLKWVKYLEKFSRSLIVILNQGEVIKNEIAKIWNEKPKKNIVSQTIETAKEVKETVKDLVHENSKENIDLGDDTIDFDLPNNKSDNHE